MVKDRTANGFKAAILICSDRAFNGIRSDETAPLLQKRLTDQHYTVCDIAVVPDERTRIKSMLENWIARGVSLILTSGGTGMAPTDVTPEVTLDVIDRRVPGMEEAMRRVSQEITSHAMISRSVVGIADRSLIINLPGKPKGALENLEVVRPILRHALDLVNGGKPDQ